MIRFVKSYLSYRKQYAWERQMAKQSAIYEKLGHTPYKPSWPTKKMSILAFLRFYLEQKRWIETAKTKRQTAINVSYLTNS